MFGKAPLTSREALMRSIGSMSAMVSWRKMAPCRDRPGMAAQRLAGMWGSRWGRMRRRRMVQRISYLRDCTDYGAPVVRVCPVPFVVGGADNACPVWWQGGLPRDDVPEAVGENAEEVGGKVVVCLRREAIVACCFVLLWMTFQTSWMVKGRFSSCLLWAWLRRILAWVSASSVSWVGVCCRRKLSWVALSTVAWSLVRKPSSCRTAVMVRWPMSVMAR